MYCLHGLGLNVACEPGPSGFTLFSTPPNSSLQDRYRYSGNPTPASICQRLAAPCFEYFKSFVKHMALSLPTHPHPNSWNLGTSTSMAKDGSKLKMPREGYYPGSHGRALNAVV